MDVRVNLERLPGNVNNYLAASVCYPEKLMTYLENVLLRERITCQAREVREGICAASNKPGGNSFG